MDIAGKKYGKLTAIKISGKTNSGNIKWIFKCDCGNTTEAIGSDVRNGHTKSCGCLKANNNYKHGQGKKNNRTSEYTTWASMMTRCYNENDENYNDYGKRGIRVCERWHSFENFFEDMGKKPRPEYSLDRYPNNATGHYEPNNCRWASVEQQVTNKRNNVWLTYKGVTMLLRDWLIKLQINRGNFYQRKKKGFSHIQLLEFYDKKKAA